MELFIWFSIVPGFDIVPDSADGIVSIGEQATFHCKASEGFVIAKWDVTTPTTRTLSTNVLVHSNLLLSLGITFSISMSGRESNLTLNATSITNGSKIQCEVEQSANRLNARASPPVWTSFGKSIYFILFYTLNSVYFRETAI